MLSENCTVVGICGKKMVEPDRPQMTVQLRRMRCTCRRATAGIQIHYRFFFNGTTAGIRAGPPGP